MFIWQSDESDTDEIPAEQRVAVQDTYGYIKWHLKFMPNIETPESQQKKKYEMKMLSEQPTFNQEVMKTLIECIYYSQRKAVNTGTDL